MRRLGVSLFLLVLPVLSRAATIPVIDTATLAQMAQQAQQQINMFREMIEQTKQQVMQIYNQIQQIEHAARTVEHGAQNLLTLDLDSWQALLALSDQLDQKLAYAESLGFQSGQTWQQAQQLYPQITGVLNGKQQRDLKRQWAAAERQTAHVALETQAIAESQRQYRQEWQEAMAAAVQARGAHQIAQAQAQMMGIQGNQLQQIQQHLATEARHTTERTLREASETELEVNAAERATEAYNLSGYSAADGSCPCRKRGRSRGMTRLKDDELTSCAWFGVCGGLICLGVSYGLVCPPL